MEMKNYGLEPMEMKELDTKQVDEQLCLDFLIEKSSDDSFDNLADQLEKSPRTLLSEYDNNQGIMNMVNGDT